jgi:16S rRNA (cytidine1402-2'-O)-methyltransferase
MTGPSSIFLALMASGLNGQHFSFLGYLPKERGARIRAIREMEHSMQRTGASQIFMETPYRNDHLLEDLLKTCHEETLLCVAASLTTTREFILTQSIGAWRKSGYRPGKQPVMFILGKER